jgi:hypothetical protein
VVEAVHAPPPEQLAEEVPIPPVHEAARHDVDDPGYAQAVRAVPSHEPPHTLPSLAHAARPPTGAPVIALHVPALPPELHASH